MRKHYFFVLLTILSIVVNGQQINKGSVLLGGQIIFFDTKIEADELNQKSQGATVGISIGKAFKENRVLGLNLSYAPTQQSNLWLGGDTVNLDYKRLEIGAFYRAYKSLAKDLFFFGEVEAAYTTSRQTDEFEIASNTVKTTQRGGYLALTPGIAYSVFKNFQLEITIPGILSLQYIKTKSESKVTQVKSYEREELYFYSSLKSNTALGYLGVGFRFLL